MQQSLAAPPNVGPFSRLVYVAYGSIASVPRRPAYVRFTLDSDRIATSSVGRFVPNSDIRGPRLCVAHSQGYTMAGQEHGRVQLRVRCGSI